MEYAIARGLLNAISPCSSRFILLKKRIVASGVDSYFLRIFDIFELAYKAFERTASVSRISPHWGRTTSLSSVSLPRLSKTHEIYAG